MATKDGFSRSVDSAAPARVHSLVSTRRIEAEMLKEVALICGIGLTISLLLIINGVDLSIGFF